MNNNFGSDTKSVLQAQFDAQKIAFGPIMFQAAKALRDLGILEFLGKSRKNGSDIESVAKALALSVYGVKVLLEAGLSLEVVILQDDRFVLTKTGRFILKDALTKVNMNFTNDVNYLGMIHLQDSIKSGKPDGLKVFGNWETVYEGLSELPEKVRESWFGFDHYYSDDAFPEVMPILFKDKPKSILDVGGNTGKFSLFCAQYDPDISLTILDLPGQVNVARTKILNAGFEDRIRVQAVNLLDNAVPFPIGHDVIWMSQFLDCFSQDEILGLLKRAFAALSEEGTLYILEPCWDKQEHEASTYCLHATSLYFTAMANGNSQMYHSRDLEKLIQTAGLVVEEIFEHIGVSHTLFKCKIKPSRAGIS